MRRVFNKNTHWNWALLDQGLVSGTNFVVGIVLVRYLGIEQYGIFSLVWMAVLFVRDIQNALIAAPMISIAPKLSLDERGSYYASTFMMQVMLVISVVVLTVIYILIPPQYKPTWINNTILLPLLVCFIFVQFQDYMRRNLFSNAVGRRAFYVDLLAYGGQLPLIFFVVRSYPSVETALMVTTVSMLASVGMGCRWLNITPVSKKGVIHATSRHWVSSKWLLGSAVLRWLSGNYFLLVAAVVLGPAVVGAIRAGQNLFGLTHILFQGLDNVVPREASNHYMEGGVKGLRLYLSKVMLLLLISTGLVALVAAIFAEPLLLLVYGSLDLNSVKAMIWFVPIYVLIAACFPLRIGLRTLEKTRAIFVAYFIVSVFSIVTASFLISQYALNGVMLGMLVVEIIKTLVLSILLYSGQKE